MPTTPPMSKPSRTALFSPSRTLIIAGSTFTQLMRMKVFYFLLVFILLTIGINFFELPHTMGPESVGADKLIHLKSPMIAMMLYFGVIIAIVATSLVIPKDMEDRTLYTILAKPVPRLDYLLGKLFGILALILVGLLAMDVLLNAVLHYHTQDLLDYHLQLATNRAWPPEAIESGQQEILRQGPSWHLQGAIFSIFLLSSIIAAAALLISTFSSSTLFTVICTTMIYFVGHFIADGHDYYVRKAEVQGGSTLTNIAADVLTVIFPDFRPFNVIDAAVAGKSLPPDIMLKLVGITAMYIGIYTVLSWFIFSDKEI